MRKLNTKDMMKIVSLAGKIGFKAKEALKGDGEELTNIQIGLAFFSVAMQHAEKDFTEFLASIAEMEIQEFEEMPFDYPLQVIEHLAENEDLTGFLERVSILTKKLSKNA